MLLLLFPSVRKYLELLSQQNRILAGMEFSKDELVTCKGKDVLVIGGRCV